MHSLTPFGVLVVLALSVGCPQCRRHVETQPEVPRGESEMERVPVAPVESEIRAERKGLPAPEGAPETLEQALPPYPSVALVDRVECSAQVLYHVETDGTATVVRIDWEQQEPLKHREAFETAIRRAADRWRFKPAYRIEFTNADEGPLYHTKTIPKAAKVIIRFRIVDGKPIVEGD